MSYSPNKIKGPVVSLPASSAQAGPRSTYRAGITLIELIVSVALLSVAITGPMMLAAHSIKASGAARNEMIATHLAEEGLEFVHSMRDNLSAEDNTDREGIINGIRWMQEVFSKCPAGGCIVDVTKHAASNVWNNATAVISCPANCSAMSIVYLNPETGLYRQSASALGSPWVATFFKRIIYMTGIDDPASPQREVRVTVNVTYPSYGGTTRTISISESFLNWFPYLH